MPVEVPVCSRLRGVQPHPSLAPGSLGGQGMKARVLIPCTGKSARSQMAAGCFAIWDTMRAISSRWRAPAPRSNQARPEAIAVVRELAIDISGHRSNRVDVFAGRQFDGASRL